MFDTTCADRSAFRVGDLGRIPESANLDAGGVITWEEHCVECGQPECFKTCKFYERNFDGKCRRFGSGIVYLPGVGHGIEFRRWSKLEGVYTGRMRSGRVLAACERIDRGLSAVMRMINRLMAVVPGRIGAITIYRRLKLWADRIWPLGRDSEVQGLVMCVWASRPVRLHFTVIAGEHEIHNDAVDLTVGWNDRHLTMPPVRRGNRLLLFSTEEAGFTLVFRRLDLVAAAGRTVGETLPVKDKSAGSPAKFVKCVAWDLDNTLWHGILVEDGVEKLTLNETAVRVIKELDRRGIVHTVLSKNDHAAAWAALEKFGMAEYFVFPFINWLPKSANLAAAAKTININPNTFAFVDDSSFERGEVGERFPQVRIFKETDIAKLPDLPEFNPPVSAESAGRRLSYQREMQRVAAAATFDGDYDEFLRSCRIELEFFDLRTAAEAEYERCYELIQRSNQLTLTGNRYEAAAFKELVMSPGMRAWGIRCHDKFGDYGIIGCVIIGDEGEGAWRVKEFVMSCRVAKKGCEKRTIAWVREQVTANGGKSLVADIVDTGRNGALREAFAGIEWGA